MNTDPQVDLHLNTDDYIYPLLLPPKAEIKIGAKEVFKRHEPTE